MQRHTSKILMGKTSWKISTCKPENGFPNNVIQTVALKKIHFSKLFRNEPDHVRVERRYFVLNVLNFQFIVPAIYTNSSLNRQ
jgi:hypothetical protein